jgi:hypothetical protein
MSALSFMFFMTQIGPITPFGLGEPFPGTTWLLVSLTLLLLLVYWLRTAVWFGFANRLAGLPAFWLRLLLAAVTLLAVLTAPSLPLLLFTWSLLLLAWAAVALPLPDLVQTKRGFVWLWGPLAAWTVTAAAFPLPNSLYDQINSIPTAGHLIMGPCMMPSCCWKGRRQACSGCWDCWCWAWLACCLTENCNVVRSRFC